MHAEMNELQKQIQVKSGTKIITENEVSQKMYIVQKGKARVFKTYLGQRVTLAIVGEGEIFGELSFVDGQPRSASVQALTDMELIVLDGAKGAEQLKELPPWVWLIFRTVFFRFRELDRQLVTLQSAVSYRKKGLKHDVVASTIYLEMMRFMRTIRLITTNRMQSKGSLKVDDVYDEVDDLVGNKAIGLRPFWRSLQDYDFFERDILDKTGEVVIVNGRFDKLEKSLEDEITRERYLLLSHGAISVLRQIIVYLENHNSLAPQDKEVAIDLKEINLRSIPEYEQALEELRRHQIIPASSDAFRVPPDSIYQLYIHQLILKQFDHTAIYVD